MDPTKGVQKFLSTNTVFLGNLSPDVTEEDIINVFGQCGDILELRLKRLGSRKKGTHGKNTNFSCLIILTT